MWFARPHYCGNGWLILPQGHLQAGLHSPTSPAPLARTQPQPNQSIQHPRKFIIPSHSHLPNSMSWLFIPILPLSWMPRIFSFHSTSLHQPYLSFKRPVKYPSLWKCSSIAHPLPTPHPQSNLSLLSPCQPITFMGCWAHSDHHWLNLSTWISMSFICLWLRSLC